MKYIIFDEFGTIAVYDNVNDVMAWFDNHPGTIAWYRTETR